MVLGIKNWTKKFNKHAFKIPCTSHLLDKTITDLLDFGVISEVVSSWSSIWKDVS
jgi:hypothetical protein